jgi:hypothetical protein
MQVKEAVELATRQLPEVFPASQGRELTLEGVEKTEDSRFWKITLSYPAGDEGFARLDREYKTVKLRDSDGEFMGARTGFLIDSL